jgi:toxin ParE1/3/4
VRKYRVRILAEAEQDLFETYRYIAANDSPDRAEYVLDQLEGLCSQLASMPQRGHVPPELDQIGVMDYREVHFKPYRVIYQIIGQDVYVHGVLDGRRNMQSLLERRLLLK